MIINFEDAIKPFGPFDLRHVESQTETEVTLNNTSNTRQTCPIDRPSITSMTSNRKRSIESQTDDVGYLSAKRLCLHCESESTNEELFGIMMTVAEMYQPLFTAVEEKAAILSFCSTNSSAAGEFDFSPEEEILHRLLDKRKPTPTPKMEEETNVGTAGLETHEDINGPVVQPQPTHIGFQMLQSSMTF
ncbi:hypothetical protein ScPMuIL_019006 [Solemya velum]